MKVTRTYVYESCTVLEKCVRNALYVGGLELVREIAANAVEYGTGINGILQLKTIHYCI